MKKKVTRKNIKEQFSKIIKIGYCNAQYLLNYENPFAYSTRAEGWACDYYDINGVLISTGYAPIESKNTNCNYDIVKEYEDKARKIVCDYNLAYEEKTQKVKELLSEFISKACIGGVI